MLANAWKIWPLPVGLLLGIAWLVNEPPSLPAEFKVIAPLTCVLSIPLLLIFGVLAKKWFRKVIQ